MEHRKFDGGADFLCIRPEMLFLEKFVPKK